MDYSSLAIHNLPPQSTEFVGRRSEIRALVSRLQDDNCRLLTLVGSGGIGKTRLAIECIPYLIESNFENGAFYIPLAPLTSADNIITTIINVLGIHIGDDGTSRQELVKFLSQRNLLLVMDNFEHVIDGADIVADILHSAPHVKILVTSREMLNLSMEHVWHVRGMRYPDSNEPDAINQYDALNLFVVRAMQIRRDFSPGDEQVTIIQICQLVDGLPLAIELAAGWLKTLSCQDIIQKIEQGIDFLATRNRDIAERHRSIRAVFDHSWHLLSPDEQAVFPRLSVFRGGFTIEAAEQVAGASLTILSGLVEKSMVRRDNSGRYDIHELLRQYADEKLKHAGETESTQSAHVIYFASFMRERAIDIKGRRQPEGLDETETDFDNIVEAWYRASHTMDYDALNNMMEALLFFCRLRAIQHTGFDLFKYALDIISEAHPLGIPATFNHLRLYYLYMWTNSSIQLPHDHIYPLLDDCLIVAKQNHDDMAIMLYHYIRGELYKGLYQTEESLAHLQQARELVQHLHQPYYEAEILRAMDYIHSQHGGDIEVSKAIRSLTYEIGDVHGYGLSFGFQGFRERNTFNLAGAEKCVQIALKSFRLIKDTRMIGAITFFRGYLMCVRGNFDIGDTYLAEAQKLTMQVNFLWNHCKLFTVRMIVNLVKDNLDIAYEYKQSATTYFPDAGPDGHPLYYLGQAMYEVSVGHYDNALPHILQAVSINMPFTQHVKATALILMAFIRFDEHKPIDATELLGLALGQFAHMTVWVKDWKQLVQLRADLKDRLGEQAYHQAWERGAHRDLNDTIAELLIYLGNDQSPEQAKSQPLIEPLTTREIEVLELLGQGLSNPKIANKLIVSVGTVKAHVYNICQKLGVNNRTQAVLEAKKIGLL